MKKGIVKWFNVQKGYGFITSDDVDYFVHYSSIQGDGFKKLDEGETVSFDVEEKDGKRSAINVTRE